MRDGALAERIDDFEAFGVRAFTTTRARGSFGTASEEPTRVVTERWAALRRELAVADQRPAERGR